MNILFFSFAAVLFGLGMFFLCRKSLASLLIISVTVFVLALPWIRFIFSGGILVEQNHGISYAYLMFVLFVAGAAFAYLKFKGYGSFSYNLIDWIRLNDSKNIIKYSIIILLVAWGLRIYRAVVYGIFFSGSGNEDAIAGMDYIFVVVYSLIGMLSMGAYFCLCAIRERLSFYMASFLSAEVVWSLISSGRRDFIFYVGIFLFFYIFIDKKINYKSAVVISLLSYVFVSVVTPMFIQARINVLNYMESRDAIESVYYGLMDALSDVYGSGGSAKQVVADNLLERGDAAEFAGKIYTFQDESSRHTYGDSLLNAFSWAVPSFLIKKPNLMVEQYIQDFYGMPLIDDAVSWVTVGYADFSYFGCFLYGSLVVVLIYLIIGIGEYSGNVFLYITASVQACYIAYSVEADPLLMFSSVRDVCIIFFALYFVGLYKSLFRN